MSLENHPAYIKYVESIRLQFIDLPKSDIDAFLTQYLESVADQYEDYQNSGKINTIEEFINNLEKPENLHSKLKSELSIRPTISLKIKSYYLRYLRYIQTNTITTSYATSIFIVLMMILVLLSITRDNQNEFYTQMVLFIPISGIAVFLVFSQYSRSKIKQTFSVYFLLTLGNIVFLINLTVIIFGIYNPYTNQFYAYNPKFNTHLNPIGIFAGLLLFSFVLMTVIWLYFLILKPQQPKIFYTATFLILFIILILYLTSNIEASSIWSNVNQLNYEILLIMDFLIWLIFISLYNLGVVGLFKKNLII